MRERKRGMLIGGIGGAVGGGLGAVSGSNSLFVVVCVSVVAAVFVSWAVGGIVK